jgi:hypothetical protein
MRKRWHLSLGGPQSQMLGYEQLVVFAVQAGQLTLALAAAGTHPGRTGCFDHRAAYGSMAQAPALVSRQVMVLALSLPAHVRQPHGHGAIGTFCVTASMVPFRPPARRLFSWLQREGRGSGLTGLALTAVIELRQWCSISAADARQRSSPRGNRTGCGRCRAPPNGGNCDAAMVVFAPSRVSRI